MTPRRISYPPPRRVLLGDVLELLGVVEALRWPAMLAELDASGAPQLSKGNYLEDQLMNWLRGTTFPAAPANVYASLHTADPGETGASEHGATAGYTRKIIGFGAGNPASNAAIVEYAQASTNYSAAITHFGVWDALSGGNFLGGSILTNSRTISTGDIPRWAAGALTWTED